MARFSSSEELQTILGDFFEKVAATPQAYLIDQVGGVVDFVYHRPEGRLCWVPSPGDDHPFFVERGGGKEPPLLTFEQDGDTAHRFWLGRLNLQDAMARQLVRARGPLSRAMKLIPNLDEIYPLYGEHLQAIGREDWMA